MKYLSYMKTKQAVEECLREYGKEVWCPICGSCMWASWSLHLKLKEKGVKTKWVHSDGHWFLTKGKIIIDPTWWQFLNMYGMKKWKDLLKEGYPRIFVGSLEEINEFIPAGCYETRLKAEWEAGYI